MPFRDLVQLLLLGASSRPAPNTRFSLSLLPGRVCTALDLVEMIRHPP